jgi:hypothetical protein
MHARLRGYRGRGSFGYLIQLQPHTVRVLRFVLELAPGAEPGVAVEADD